MEQCEVTLAFSVTGTQEQNLFHQSRLLLKQPVPEDSKVACQRPTPALLTSLLLLMGISGLMGPRREGVLPAKQNQHGKLPASSASLDMKIENLLYAIQQTLTWLR